MERADKVGERARETYREGQRVREMDREKEVDIDREKASRCRLRAKR